MNRSRVALSVALSMATMLAACGPTPAEVQLGTAAQDCSAGYGPACDALYAIQAQAQAERAQQDAAAAVAGVIGAAALVGGVVAATNDRGYYRGRGYRYGRYRRW